jgi:hypothetical protein
VRRRPHRRNDESADVESGGIDGQIDEGYLLDVPEPIPEPIRAHSGASASARGTVPGGTDEPSRGRESSGRPSDGSLDLRQQVVRYLLLPARLRSDA